MHTYDSGIDFNSFCDFVVRFSSCSDSANLFFCYFIIWFIWMHSVKDPDFPSNSVIFIDYMWGLTFYSNVENTYMTTCFTKKRGAWVHKTSLTLPLFFLLMCSIPHQKRKRSCIWMEWYRFWPLIYQYSWPHVFTKRGGLGSNNTATFHWSACIKPGNRVVSNLPLNILILVTN